MLCLQHPIDESDHMQTLTITGPSGFGMALCGLQLRMTDTTIWQCIF